MRGCNLAMNFDRTGPAAADASSRQPAATHALALAALFAAELALFWSATSRHVSWAYPRWYDQLQYLDEAYNGYDWMRLHGFASGVRHVLGHVSPQGSLHGLLALLVFAVTGPSRTAALAVNLLAFLALQAATFLSVRRVCGGYPLAWASVGLLAAAAGPWSGGGGSAADFRLDWMASCAYGVALAVAAAGGWFRSARWSAMLGAAVGLVMLTRFLTAVYFSIIFLVAFAWILSRPRRWSRCARLLLSAACALAVSGWALWRARRVMYDYYWMGHIAGSERALRDSHLGLVSSMARVCSEILLRQVGWRAMALGLAAAAALLACRWMSRSRAGQARNPAADARGAWAMALLFAAAPAGVLVLHPEKASAPFSIILPAAVWVMVLALSRLSRRTGPACGAATFGAVALMGAAFFGAGQLGSAPPRELEAEFRDVNALSDYLYFRSEEAGLTHPRVAVTMDVDALSAEIFRLVGRERHQRLLPFVATLPTGLFATTPEIVMARLAESDFVCLVTRAPINWPFDRQMMAMLAETRGWCDGNLRHAGDLETAEFAAAVYERKSLARPPGGGVDLRRMIADASQGPAHARARPPERPVFLTPARLSWTTKGELRYAVRTAYSPVTLRAAALAEGLGFDHLSGEIRGLFPREGVFEVTLAAENERGVSRRAVSFRVTGASWDAEIDPPREARVGIPVDIGFGAFDVDGGLNYIDVTDLTTVTSLGRVVPDSEQHAIWQGHFELTFAGAGRHTVQFRFVRYDPGSREPYVFVDRTCAVDVAP